MGTYVQHGSIKNRGRRAAAFGMTLALAGGMTLLSALPAAAATVDEDGDEVVDPSAPDDSGLPSMETYYVGGSVAVDYGDWTSVNQTFDVTILDEDGDAFLPTQHVAAEDYGYFEFEAVPNGDYTLEADSTDKNYPTTTAEIPFTVENDNYYDFADPILLAPSPSLTGAAVTYTGDLVVGSTLTGSVVTPFAEPGVDVSVTWGQGRGESGGEIEGATGNTLLLTEDMVGSTISFVATGTKDGYSPTSVSYFTKDLVTAPKKAAAPAPVANSSDLSAYLEAHFAPPVGADVVGLPLAGLNPGKDYTANVAWYSGDSFVDVYAYSTATYIGTFAVVDGAVQVDLTSDQLTALGAGAHTLVAVGQSSGGVNSAGFTVTAVLASTGFDPMVPMGAAAALLVLGGGLMVLRRRIAAKQ